MPMPTPDGEKSMSNSDMEKELIEAGWQPTAVHPNSATWFAPDVKIYPGPGYAWMLMTEQKLKDNKQ